MKRMKKFLIILALVAVMALNITGCSKEDEHPAKEGAKKDAEGEHPDKSEHPEK